MPKGEISRRRKEEGIKRTREAIAGKVALLCEYETLGRSKDPEVGKLLNKIYRLRVALKNRTGDEE